jgi:hypothetical protein
MPKNLVLMEVVETQKKQLTGNKTPWRPGSQFEENVGIPMESPSN